MRLRLALVLVASCGVEGGPAPPRLSHAGASRAHEPSVTAERVDKLEDNARCEGCHADVAAEWRSSLHARSWDDPVFLSAYAIEPLAFCRGCHAPEAPLEDASSPARHLGVACITCHVPKGEAAAGTHLSFKGRGADAEGCASCHQFEFPEPQEAAMQSTVEEHAASPQRDQTCGSCHMRAHPGERPHKDHTFRVQGDAALLRSALTVSARRGLERTVDVTLIATGAGHAVPTGDMFRRLEVHATAGEGPQVVHATPIVLSRELEVVMTEHGPRRRQVRDRRVPASGEPAEARLVFPQEVTDLPIRWEVIYRRMGPREAALFGVDLESEALVVAHGTLGPSAAR